MRQNFNEDNNKHIDLDTIYYKELDKGFFIGWYRVCPEIVAQGESLTELENNLNEEMDQYLSILLQMELLDL